MTTMARCFAAALFQPATLARVAARRRDAIRLASTCRAARDAVRAWHQRRRDVDDAMQAVAVSNAAALAANSRAALAAGGWWAAVVQRTGARRCVAAARIVDPRLKPVRWQVVVAFGDAAVTTMMLLRTSCDADQALEHLATAATYHADADVMPLEWLRSATEHAAVPKARRTTARRACPL